MEIRFSDAFYLRKKIVPINKIKKKCVSNRASGSKGTVS